MQETIQNQDRASYFTVINNVCMTTSALLQQLQPSHFHYFPFFSATTLILNTDKYYIFEEGTYRVPSLR